MLKSLFRKSSNTRELQRTASETDNTESANTPAGVPATPVLKRRKSDINELLPELLNRDDVKFRVIESKITDLYELDTPFYTVGAKSVTRCKCVKTGASFVMKQRVRDPAAPESERAWRSIMSKILRIEYCPNIVQIHEILEDETSFYIVMEECSGGQLLDYLLNKATMTQRECKRLVRDILIALAKLHEVGLIHRDIKPENIMFSNTDFENEETNHLKLIDFDTCEEVGSDKLSLSATTPSRKRRSRRVIGTLGYIAPESFNGEYSAASDLFSVGIILFILITGDMPFDDSIYHIGSRDNRDGSSASDPEPLDDIQIVGSPRNKRVVNELKASKIDWDANPWPQVPQARNLCQRLLELGPDERLSSAKDALSHPWLSSSKSVPTSPIRKTS